MRMPGDHALRYELNDEVHARPPEALRAPCRVSYLALACEGEDRDRQWQGVEELAQELGVEPPPPGANHYTGDFGSFRLKWERHTEYTRYTFIVNGEPGKFFSDPAIGAAPLQWVASLPGRVMVACHVGVMHTDEGRPDFGTISREYFEANELVGAEVAGGAGAAFTDFRIHDDGFSRVLIHRRSMTPRQTGRTLQRLTEIDTYRMMALLALPVARDLAPSLTRCERELTRIMSDLVGAGESDEPDLLERLTRLQAEIESNESQHSYRFAAAEAYYDVVRSRIAALREQRIQGLQTFREFTERRLDPAMKTCQAVAVRQRSLSERLSRATQLLSTRVDMTRERQSQELLESMDRRARLQLRLQETVEGLSVAAITYYIVGLVGYAAKAMHTAGMPVNAELVMGVSIPVVAILALIGVRKIRRMVKRDAA